MPQPLEDEGCLGMEETTDAAATVLLAGAPLTNALHELPALDWTEVRTPCIRPPLKTFPIACNRISIEIRWNIPPGARSWHCTVSCAPYAQCR